MRRLKVLVLGVHLLSECLNLFLELVLVGDFFLLFLKEHPLKIIDFAPSFMLGLVNLLIESSFKLLQFLVVSPLLFFEG